MSRLRPISHSVARQRRVEEVRRAEFFRRGMNIRGLIKGEKMAAADKGIFKAYLPKESLERLFVAVQQSPRAA